MFSSSSKHTDKESFSSLKTEEKPPLITPQNGATVIARGVKLEGDFTSQGDVVIEGEVRGKVTASGKLTVGSEAVIHADVSANDATISGFIEGNVVVKGQLVLHATAKIAGDLTAERVSVESGAVLNGQVTVGAAEQKPAAATEAAPPKEGHKDD